MSISERAAYLKGLADGMNLDTATGEGKLFAALIDTIGEIADELEVLSQSNNEIVDEIDEINDELNDIAELFDDLYEEEDEDDDDDLDFDEEDDEYEYEDDDVFYVVKCPSCDEEITVDEGILDAGSITCPACGEELEFDLGEACEDEPVEQE